MISFCAIIRALASNMNKRQPFSLSSRWLWGSDGSDVIEKLRKVAGWVIKVYKVRSSRKTRKVRFVLTAAGVRVREPFLARITDLTSLSNDFFLLQLCSPLCFALFYEALNFLLSKALQPTSQQKCLCFTKRTQVESLNSREMIKPRVLSSIKTKKTSPRQWTVRSEFRETKKRS